MNKGFLELKLCYFIFQDVPLWLWLVLHKGRSHAMAE